MLSFHAFINKANLLAYVSLPLCLNPMETDIEDGAIIHGNVYVFIDDIEF
jgi:hypothetical protein